MTSEKAAGGPASEIPGFLLESVLGEGGMGVVVRARELALDRLVAIKFMTGPPDPSAAERFLREARVAATIEHPQVVRVYSFGTEGSRPYIVMQYIEGETLAQRIARRGPLPIAQALRVASETAEALRAAWEHQVVHRDVKPSNILLDARGRAHVADFGLAKPIGGTDSSLTVTGSFVGTPYYTSPEQAEAKPLDFRADMYSLGIILYEMLTGERPFDGSSPAGVIAKHLREPLPSPRRLRPDLPKELEALLVSMTAKSPDERPLSYTALLATLDEIARVRVVRSSARTRVAIAAAATITALAAGVLLYQSRKSQTPSGTEIAVVAATTSSDHSQSMEPSPALPPRLLFPGDAAIVEPPQVMLDWSLLRDASRYHVEVATDAAFGDALIATDAEPPLRVAVEGGRIYHWRVATLDATGRRGEFAPSRRFMVSLAPPAAITPHHAVFRDAVLLQWQRVEEASSYSVRIRGSNGFAVEKTARDTKIELPPLPQGTYEWSVASVDGRGIAGKASEVRVFRMALAASHSN